MRNAKLLGIIALVAVMGLGLMGCAEDPPPSAAPVGDIVIEAEYGFFPNYPLTADVNVSTESGTVFIGWLKADDAGIADDEDITTDYNTFLNKLVTVTNNSDYTKFRISTAGRYVAILVDGVGWTNWGTPPQGTSPVKPLFFVSDVIVIEVLPEHADFLGNWKTTEKFQPSDDLTGPKVDETLTIGDKLFKLESEQVKNGVQQGISWTIKSWTSLSGADLTIVTTPASQGVAEVKTTFDEGYELSVSVIPGTNKGYTAFTSFRVYKNASGSPVVLARTNQSKVYVRSYNQTATPETVSLQ